MLEHFLVSCLVIQTVTPCDPWDDRCTSLLGLFKCACARSLNAMQRASKNAESTPLSTTLVHGGPAGLAATSKETGTSLRG